MLPPFVNALVFLINAPSIDKFIRVPDLTKNTTLIVTRTLAVIPVFTCVLLIYYALAMFAVKAVTVLERRVGRWRPRVSGS
jgi:ABC-type amino acid transport system permease subunit